MTLNEFKEIFIPIASVPTYRLTDRKIDALVPLYYSHLKSYGKDTWKAIALDFVDSPEDAFPKPDEFVTRLRIRLMAAVEKQEAAREGDPQSPGALKARREFYETLARLYNTKQATKDGIIDTGDERPITTPIYGLVEGLLHSPARRQENWEKSQSERTFQEGTPF